MDGRSSGLGSFAWNVWRAPSGPFALSRTSDVDQLSVLLEDLIDRVAAEAIGNREVAAAERPRAIDVQIFRDRHRNALTRRRGDRQGPVRVCVREEANEAGLGERGHLAHNVDPVTVTSTFTSSSCRTPAALNSRAAEGA